MDLKKVELTKQWFHEYAMNFEGDEETKYFVSRKKITQRE